MWKRLLLVVVASCSVAQAVAADVAVSVVSDRQPGRATAHGLEKVTAALRAKKIAVNQAATLDTAEGNILIVAGLVSGSGPAADLLKSSDIRPPIGPEALLIRHTEVGGKPALLVAGADDRGLMYALLDVADRIGWADDAAAPLGEVKNVTEKPAVSERALSIYTMHRTTFERFFYDEDYWAKYLDMLAENRFNTFALILGYENWGYFSPPYPFFFDVEEFADVRVVGITKRQQQRNLKALNRVIEMAHDRGLNFTLGIWDHIYRGGVQGPAERAEKPTEGVVWGLTQENLTPYTQAAFTKFLALVPNLDAIQFRMHGESGLRRGEMDRFWTDIFRIMKESGGGIRVDARAKNFPDSLIDRALEIGVPIRICTKYWMEQMGLPYHPTHIHPRNQFDRRHGYADLLRYPKRYQMHWRLWTGGTTRILLWGDPEYVRRFAESTHLYDGEGFEVTAPLATKMQDHPHELAPFDLLTAGYRYYDWEFERYWHFFQVFGRVGYNPNTPPEVWQKEFERRFGAEAAPYVERGLHRASQILPRIVAYSIPYHHFPTTRGWAARQRQDDLSDYAKALPSDTQQFLSIDEAARFRLEAKDSAKILPSESSAWFARAANDVLELASKAEKFIGDDQSKEFVSTMVDLRILANLALYHSWRARAGVDWALFEHSRDLHALDDAIRRESLAVDAWTKIVDAAGDVYHDDIMMGDRRADLSGHWRDELVKLKRGLERLKTTRKSFSPVTGDDGPAIAHVPIRNVAPGKDTVIRATVFGKQPIANVSVVYGNDSRGFTSTPMATTEPMLYRLSIPAAQVARGFAYHIEAIDTTGRKTSFPPDAKAANIAVMVTGDREPPLVLHEPIRNAPLGKALKIAVHVTDPSGVKSVRLRYRSVNQHQDYQTLEMRPTASQGEYEAEVPGEQLNSEWDFMYLIEVIDQAGNGAIYPDLEKEQPYVIVKLDRPAVAGTE